MQKRTHNRARSIITGIEIVFQNYTAQKTKIVLRILKTIFLE